MVSTPHSGGAAPRRFVGQFLAIGGLVLLASCNKPGFNAVSIRPIDGWIDGCNAIVIGGSGFGTDVKATIGGADILSPSLPDADSTDYGYMLMGIAPPSATGLKGYQDVVVTSGEKSDTITGSGAYYYKDCPQVGYIETVTPAEGLAAGTSVTLSGCGLDATALKAILVDSTGTQVGSEIALTASCGKGVVTFAAPTVPADGVYNLELVDGSGAVVAGTPCPPPDTADTSGGGCVDFKLTYGAS